MAYAILRINKIKSQSGFAALYGHNYRTIPPANADRKLSNNNYDLIQMQESNYYLAMKQRLKQLDYYQEKHPRKNAVLGLEVLLTFSHDAKINLEKWQSDNLEWLQERFGKENIISAVVHLDEEVPHIHAIVVPEKDGRLNCNAILGGKKEMRELQTNYAQAMQKHNLERGLHRVTAKREDIQRFYAAMNKELKRELPPIQKGILGVESAQSYKKRADEIMIDTFLQNLGIAKELNRKKRELAHYQKAAKELEEKLKSANKTIELYKDDSENFQSLLYLLEAHQDLARKLYEIMEQESQEIEKEKWYQNHNLEL